MQFSSLTNFLTNGTSHLSGGPVGILLMEDLSETNSTIRHHLKIGFENLLVLGPEALKISPELTDRIIRITADVTATGATVDIINRLIPVLLGRWVYYGYNSEYLFFPFCETRSIGEITGFVGEERRDSVLTYVVDLYADNLAEHADGVSLDDAHLDKSGYYATARSRDGEPMDRQLDMFGGLRWRFEEHIPQERRKIDRIGLFKAQKGLKLRGDHTFNIEEYNTYACPWHHNPTATICSFRAAKSLRSNPGSAPDVDSFSWHNSQKFNWHSRQLLDLGLMEPGQWF